jgi:hypothetical protein
MSGQFLVEPEPELELEPEPVDELEEPEPVLPAPDLDDGVVEGLAVEEFDVELVRCSRSSPLSWTWSLHWRPTRRRR